MQRSELALKLKPLIGEQAKERQREHGLTAPGRKTLPKNSAEVISRGETRDEVAKLAGVSHDTIAKVEKILEKASPEKIEELRAGKTSINAVRSALVNDSYGIPHPVTYNDRRPAVWGNGSRKLCSHDR